MQWIVVGLASTGLLLVYRLIEVRYGAEIAGRDFLGLAERFPRLAVFFFVCALAMVGLPGTLGFLAEDLLIHGVMETHPYIGILQPLAAALNAMFEKGKRFEATNPEPDNAYVEFIGELAGSPQPLITVEVNTFAPGVLTFTLPLDRAEMAAALRAVAEIEVPFEVEAEIVDDGEDIADPAVPGRIITLFQQPVKVVREQIWEEMETVQPIDWLRPPQPRDYIPFTPDQIIFGVQHYVAVFGDGEARSFSFPHNLGTAAFHLTVRENKSSGKVRDGFDATIASANELTVDFPANEPPPALNSLALVISSAGPRSAFLAHTHTMAQILGLLDALAGVDARCDPLRRPGRCRCPW